MVKKDAGDIMTIVAQHYDMIRNAEIANSCIILQVLSDAKTPLSSGQISEQIAVRSLGKIYKISSTMQSSLETLRNAGLVDAKENPADKGKPKPMRLYSITKNGKDLAKAFRGFLSELD